MTDSAASLADTSAQDRADTSKRLGNNPNPKPPVGAPRVSAWLSTAVLQWMRDRISAAGGDPSQIQIEEPARMVRLPEVRRMTGLGTTSIYTWGKEGRFPRPIPLD